MFWWSVKRKQISENGQHVIMFKFALHMDCQAFPRILIYDGEHAEGAAIMGAVSDKVIRPDMALMLRTEPHARAIIKP